MTLTRGGKEGGRARSTYLDVVSRDALQTALDAGEGYNGRTNLELDQLPDVLDGLELREGGKEGGRDG